MQNRHFTFLGYREYRLQGPAWELSGWDHHQRSGARGKLRWTDRGVCPRHQTTLCGTSGKLRPTCRAMVRLGLAGRDSDLACRVSRAQGAYKWSPSGAGWPQPPASPSTTTRLTPERNARWPTRRLSQTTCCINGSSSACNQPGYPDKALTTTGHLASTAMGAPTLTDHHQPDRSGTPQSPLTSSGMAAVVIIPATDGYDNRDSAVPTLDIQDPIYGPSTQDFKSFPGDL